MKKHPTTLSTAEFYHEHTKYSPENLSASVPDPLHKPPPFKEYLSEKSIDLKPFLKGVPGSAGGIEGPRTALRSISRLLYHTGGITDIVEGRSGTIYFRAAPSAGALYPTEIYLATSGIEGLADAVYSYSVREHSLVPTFEGAFAGEISQYCFAHPAAAAGRMFLILTGVFARSAWRYRDRAYRRVLLDTGHVLGNAAAYAPAEGLVVLGLGGFFDAALGDLLFLDREEEAVLLVAPVLPRKEVEGRRAERPVPPASPRNPPPPGGPEKGAMLLLHDRSGILPGQGSPPSTPAQPMAIDLPDAAAERRPGIPIPAHRESDILAPSIGPVIRRRRSARAFGRGPLPWPRLAGVLRSSYAAVRPYHSGAGLPMDAALLLDPTMIATYLLATRVDGLASGVYRMDAPGETLCLRREGGDLQNDLWNLCLGQELGRDAAAAVFHVADLPACVERYGDRAYRYLHLDAGHLGERLNLAAVSRDVAVSGIGGFFDDEVNKLLDLPERYSTLYITLLGQPAAETAGEA